MSIEIRCYAKINLYLDVIGRLESGYHEIETLYQPIGMYDEIKIGRAEAGVRLSGSEPSIRWDEGNICHRAARLFIERAGLEGGVDITVRKRIPHGAGLGGGSSDAAAILLGINRLFGCGLDREELLDMGAGLGSDVPFFVNGKPAIGRGRGEILEETEGLAGGWIVIVKPEITISTSWAYQNIKIPLTRPGVAAKLNRLRKGLERFPEVELTAYNSFTGIAVEHYPEIGELIASMTDGGAILSSLSGSGSACFGIFSKEELAAEVEKAFNDKGLFSRIVRPVDQTVVLLRTE
jgi:4-diphosphocytidyl-2-C-methyl-D-erythritol kinase